MEYKKLFDIIQNLTGVYLTEEKKYLLDSRLNQLMKDYNLKSYDEVALKLITKDDLEFYHKVVDRITTHETRFFRDESIFDAFVKQIIPEWMEKHGNTKTQIKKPLKIWSAGCSYGQEPYSISISLLEHHPYLFPYTEILATDISKDVIERAKKGVFTDFEVQRGVPEFIKQKYFVAINEKEFKIKDEVKRNIQFQVHNLIQDPYPSGFDIIFFRNVLIYFDMEQRKIIIDKMIQSLRNQEGTLILGSSENLLNLADNYIIREFGIARYYEFSKSVTFFKKF
ncbi:MAG: protein-glutamate O-methyltransferase CheR [Leptospiraceae bacterium]|nr:protein-glutamate O-methyltransferase CheR [Leptospiraceae bacterium]MDW7975796.1 protein-glutamate O-methyltransferase CheR [Leptospiraceae bacterium]